MSYDMHQLAHLVTPSFVLYLFLLSALIYMARTSYKLFKDGETGRLGLGVSCMSGGLFLFMTVVPTFTILMATH